MLKQHLEKPASSKSDGSRQPGKKGLSSTSNLGMIVRVLLFPVSRRAVQDVWVAFRPSALARPVL